jgi:hypothetical protein
MKYQKIILAGGNGYVGTVLANYYRDLAKEIIILARTPKDQDGNIKTLVWDGKTQGAWVKELPGADMLINLWAKTLIAAIPKKIKRPLLLQEYCQLLFWAKLLPG